MEDPTILSCPMLNVFMTIDTDFWPWLSAHEPLAYLEDLLRDVYGHTPQGHFTV